MHVSVSRPKVKPRLRLVQHSLKRDKNHEAKSPLFLFPPVCEVGVVEEDVKDQIRSLKGGQVERVIHLYLTAGECEELDAIIV